MKSPYMPSTVFEAEGKATTNKDRQDHCAQGVYILYM